MKNLFKTFVLSFCLNIIGLSIFIDVLFAADWGGYVVAVSEATYNDADWRKVVEVLQKKHAAVVSVYKMSVDEIVPQLRETFPKYLCFVTRPPETSREFITSVHTLTRSIDSDPYPDLFWGVITGYDSESAIKVAEYDNPLIIKKAASGSVKFDLNRFDEGIKWFEVAKNEVERKEKGKKPVHSKDAPDDPTESMVKTLNEFKPDIWFTSGHATEHDWAIGFNYSAGSFVHKNGVIYGKSVDGKLYAVDSANPKVYMPVGNCLIGRIDGADCMATSYMRSCGVKQMIGYTVPTWFGFAGWGIADYFIGQGGSRFNFTEAYFANQIALNWRLIEAASGGESKKDLAGLKFDQNAVAFYGDPAWDARVQKTPETWKQELNIEGINETKTVSLTLTAIDENSWQHERPALQFLPIRLKEQKITQGENFNPTITDNFILVPLPKDKQTKEIKIVFNAKVI
jgi:zinc protease